ncbi:MAG: VWA domain-containing protein [Phycisphaerales bacterium JB064]
MVSVLGVLRVGPIEFAQPEWFWLLALLVPVAVLIGRKSLSGMATASRRVALVVRLLVLALLVAALARPSTRDAAEDVAVTVVVDRSRSVPTTVQERARQFVRESAEAGKETADRIGVVAAAGESIIETLPRTLLPEADRAYTGRTDQTNLAEALRLALAVRPTDAAYRIVLMSDGNETAGDLLAEARSARAQGVPIDVLPLRYSYDQEVIVEQLLAPATARLGENANLRVALRANAPARGTLTITANGSAINIDPEGPGPGVEVSLDRGLNTFVVPIRVPGTEVLRFEAVFEPEGGMASDTILENNRALATTFVAGEGKVLVLTEDGPAAQPFVRALEEAGVIVDARPAAAMPDSLVGLGSFDAIVLMNEPAANFSRMAMDQLRQYVHDAGGGLVMMGGPNTFGAGGWINSPLEDALPIRLDPPQKRQLPRGAVAIVIDTSGSMGGSVGGIGQSQLDIAKEGAMAGIGSLSSRDLATVIRFDSNAGLVMPVAEVSDKGAFASAIRKMAIGGGTNMAPGLIMALDQLEDAPAAVKHIIVLSDGQTMGSEREFQTIIRRALQTNISISTVTIGDFSNDALMQEIAAATKGRYYPVTIANSKAQLPEIFIREAQTISRPLVWEGTPFVPAFTPGLTEASRGIRGVPPISGYVVAGDREGMSVVTMRGQENDPVMAQWQHGLGRVITYTSDGLSRWNPMWLAWGDYKQFWEQHVRWTMRASGDANVRVVTTREGDRTRIVVEATDASGQRMNFATFNGRLAAPDGTGVDVSLQQTGPGIYEGVYETAQSGSYLLSMNYDAPGADGQRLRGTALAAIDRPFADEFRATQTNEALLRRVAELTGGSVLSADQADGASNPWRREGVEMPVALTSAWLATAMIAIGLFLIDVGVRRVRVDVRGIGRWVQKALSGKQETKVQQIDALRAARAKAQERLKRPDEGPSEKVRAAMRASEQRATAKARFEVSDEQLKGKQGSVVEGAGNGQPAQPKKTGKPDQPAQDEEQGMSRLLKAKQRTRDEFEDR